MRGAHKFKLRSNYQTDRRISTHIIGIVFTAKNRNRNFLYVMTKKIARGKKHSVQQANVALFAISC